MNRINFELGDLQAFIATADKLSFKAAAELLFISQPALSRRIERLESALGARLLARTTRRVTLTVAGMQFLPQARVVIEDLERAADGVSRNAMQRGSLVTVAAIPSVVNSWLPGALKKFADLYPGIRISMIDANAHSVLESVANGTADFGLNFIGAQEVGIDFRAIQKEPYVLALRKDHPLASRTAVAWSELARERLITLSERSGNRAMIDHALARVHARPEVFCQAKHVSGALGMVAAGLGVSIVPLLSVSTYMHPALTSIAVTHPAVSRTIGIIARKGNALPPAAAALYELVRKAAASKRDTGTAQRGMI